MAVRRLARWLAAAPSPGPARDGPPLAPQGLAPLLDLEVTDQAGPALPECRGQDADRPDVQGESALGQRAYPWRTAEARPRRQQPLRPPLPVTTTPAQCGSSGQMTATRSGPKQPIGDSEKDHEGRSPAPAS